jgi:hypothetical protein
MELSPGSNGLLQERSRNNVLRLFAVTLPFPKGHCYLRNSTFLHVQLTLPPETAEEVVA